jgi:hypothetical protein
MYKRKSYARKRTTTRRRRPMLRKKRTLRKRKTYTKRRTMGGSKKYVGHEPTQQLMVYLNPFSTRTQQPKFPDGSRNYSLGVSLRDQQTQTVTTTQVGYIALFAGARAFCIHSSPAAVDADGPANAAAWNDGGQGPVTTTPTDDTNADPNAGEIASWRGVSFGMKVATINNVSKDAGYWRAIRVRGCDPSVEFNKPFDALKAAIQKSNDWPNDPSFSSGTLRNLAKKDFILATENDEHSWIDVKLDGETLKTDESFDIILLQIISTEEQKILINSYGNYELAYHEKSPINRFQTQSAQCLPSTIAKYEQMKRRKTVLAAT